MTDTEMPIAPEAVNRLDIEGSTPRFILGAGLRMTAFALLGWVLIVVATLPVFLGSWLTTVGFGVYLATTLVVGARLGTIFLQYKFTMQTTTGEGTRAGTAETDGSRRTLFILSAGGVNLLFGVAVAVAALVGLVAPPVVALLAAYAVLGANELARRRVELSLSIAGVRLTAALIRWVRELSTPQQRRLTRLTMAAEWLTSGLTIVGQADPDVFYG
jgi:hypothetical protein